MNHETNWPWLFRRNLVATVWTVVLMTIAFPPTATAEVDLHNRDVAQAIGSAVIHYFYKSKKRQQIESACYFDPQVEKSMRCSWRSGGGVISMRQKVDQDAKKGCHKNGGENCTTFLRNGKLKSDVLSPEVSAKLESAFANIPSYSSVPRPLPEGGEVTENLRNRFESLGEHWKSYMKRRRAHKPHYAICSSDKLWVSVSMEGGSTAKQGLSDVSERCVLKCEAYVEWFVGQGECYLIHADGKFSSTAAQMAVKQ